MPSRWSGTRRSRWRVNSSRPLASPSTAALSSSNCSVSESMSVNHIPSEIHADTYIGRVVQTIRGRLDEYTSCGRLGSDPALHETRADLPRLSGLCFGGYG